LNLTADKQEIRSYLLGDLDDRRKTQLEEQILSAPQTYEELLLVEEELIDQYVAGGLPTLERQQFETHFLITAERQKNLRFGQLLKRYVNSHPFPVAPQNNAAAAIPHVEQGAPAKKSFNLSMLPATGRPVMVFGIAGIVLLGVALLWWSGYRRPPSRLAQQRVEPVVVVTLAPAAAPRVNVPPKGYDLKLELELANPNFRNYKSELFRENKSLQTRGELRLESKGEQFIVPLTITGEMLSPGDYEVKLCGVSESGANEFIDKYSFRVIE
jgi:LPXTG-motif cell wall-anchored protein